MTKRSWTITLDEKIHHIDISHAVWFGPCRIRVDGKIVAGGRGLRATGLSYAFDIGAHRCVAHAASTGWAWTYILAVDGNLFPANGEHTGRRFFAAQMKSVGDWHALARLLGLKYHPVSTLWPDGQHQLVGAIAGYPVSLAGYPLSISLGADERGIPEGIEITIRTAPVPDGQRFYEQLAGTPNYTVLIGGKSFRMIGAEETMLTVNSQLHLLGENPIVVADSIRAYLTWIGARVRPPRQDACEYDTGEGTHAAPARLILMNDWLRVLCDDCINNEPARRRANLERDALSLSRVVRAVIRGLPLAGFFALFCSLLLTPGNVRLASFVLVAAMLMMRTLITRDLQRRSSLNDEVAAALLGVLVVVMATPIQGIWVAARGKVPESLEAAGQIAAIAWAGLGARAASRGIYLAVVGVAFLVLAAYRLWRTRNDTREVLNPTVEDVGPWPWPSELGRATRAPGPG